MSHITIMTMVALISLLLDFELINGLMNGLFIRYWHYFFLGVLVSKVVRGGKIDGVVIGIWFVIELTFQLAFSFKIYALAALTCAFFILLLWLNNRLDGLLAGKVLGFLGAISYTLYLIHPEIGCKVISVGRMLLGESMTPLWGGVMLIIGLAASIAAAYIFHLLFEKPSLRWAHRIKLQTTRKNAESISEPIANCE